MDITAGWDFNKEEDRLKAERYVDEQSPRVFIVSPPCAAFSQLQSLIPDGDAKKKQLADGMRHMEFMVKLYRKRVEGGRVIVHENPAHGMSWGLPAIRRIMREEITDIATLMGVKVATVMDTEIKQKMRKSLMVIRTVAIAKI